MAIECSEPSCGLVVGGLNTRLDASDKSLTELHARLRELSAKLDTTMLHTEDHRNRMVLLESEHRVCHAKQSEMSHKVELFEDKLEDLRINVKKVVEGQIDILNSNATTREQFAAVLSQKDQHHLKKMKTLRTIIYIGGGLIILATQIYARWDGHETLLDFLVNMILGGPKS